MIPAIYAATTRQRPLSLARQYARTISNRQYITAVPEPASPPTRRNVPHRPGLPDVPLSTWNIRRYLEKGRNDKATKYVLRRVQPGQELRQNRSARLTVEKSILLFLRFSFMRDARYLRKRLFYRTNASLRFRMTMLAVDALYSLEGKTDDSQAYFLSRQQAHGRLLSRIRPFLHQCSEEDLRKLLNLLEELPHVTPALCAILAELWLDTKDEEYRVTRATGIKLARLKARLEIAPLEAEVVSLLSDLHGTDVRTDVPHHADEEAEMRHNGGNPNPNRSTSDDPSQDDLSLEQDSFASAASSPSASDSLPSPPSDPRETLPLRQIALSIMRAHGDIFTSFLNELHVAGALQSEHIHTALGYMTELGVKIDTPFFNTLIASAVRKKDLPRALKLYRAMVNAPDGQVLPNAFTYGSLFKGMQSNLSSRNKITQNTPSDERIVGARQLFNEMLAVNDFASKKKRQQRSAVLNTATLNIALRAFLYDADYAAALAVLRTFSELSLSPNTKSYKITVVGLLAHSLADAAQPKVHGKERWVDRLWGRTMPLGPLKDRRWALEKLLAAAAAQDESQPENVPSVDKILSKGRATERDRWPTAPLVRLLEQAMYATYSDKEGFEDASQALVDRDVKQALQEMIPGYVDGENGKDR